MTTFPQFNLVQTTTTTAYAPLAVLGFYLRNQDLFAPIRSRVQFPDGMHTLHPQAALFDLLVSMLAGCRSIRQVNTRIRPDLVLAQAWGREQFAEQSTLARVLDSCRSEQVQQLQEGITQIYRWLGQAPHHDWRQPLWVDVDLTFLPAGEKAQGATKGYVSGKKGGMVVSSAALALRSTTKSLGPCSFRATPSAISPCQQPLHSSNPCWACLSASVSKWSCAWMAVLGPTAPWSGSWDRAIRCAPRASRVNEPVIKDNG